MNRPEADVHNLGDIIQAGIQIQQDLSADRLAQILQEHEVRRVEFQKLAEEKERERIQFVNERARVMAELTAILEQFHPEELLAQVNNSQDVWRGLGVVEREPHVVDGIAWTLSSTYRKSYGYYDEVDNVRETRLGTFKTFITIGVSEKNYQKYADGRYYHGGYGLYVHEQDARLHPIAPANTFEDLMPKGLRKDLGDAYPPQIVILDADHPRASDILVEVLARSCIWRASWHKEPWRMGCGEVNQQTSGTILGAQPPRKSFWSKFFG